jgi:hypothetical protein
MPGDFEPRWIGARTKVIEAIHTLISDAKTSDPARVVIEGPDFCR